MADVELKNTPSLTAWILALAAGLVAFGIAKVIGSMDWTPSVFLGVLIALAVGIFLTIAWGGVSAAPSHAASAPNKAAMPASQAPAVETAAPPAPVMSAPVVEEAAPAAKVETSAVDEAASAAEPLRLSGPRGGKADDLKEIEGIGPALEKLVNSLGFYHFDQIANWSDADVAWVDENMKSFKGRITRDKWVAQAKIIMAEGLEAFRIRAKTNDY